jgi:hypothetical protein
VPGRRHRRELPGEDERDWAGLPSACSRKKVEETMVAEVDCGPANPDAAPNNTASAFEF